MNLLKKMALGTTVAATCLAGAYSANAAPALSQPVTSQTSVLSGMLSHAVMSGEMLGGIAGSNENLIQEVQDRRSGRRGRYGNRGRDGRRRAWGRHRNRYERHNINPGAFLALGIMGALVERGLTEDYARSAMQRCDNRFRSFEWDTGLYTTYGGERQVCPYLR
jgi:hypothetical protein